MPISTGSISSGSSLLKKRNEKKIGPKMAKKIDFHFLS